SSRRRASCTGIGALRQASQAVKGTRSNTAAVPATVGGEAVLRYGERSPAPLGDREGVKGGWRPASQETWPTTSSVRCPGPDRGAVNRRDDPVPASPLRAGRSSATSPRRAVAGTDGAFACSEPFFSPRPRPCSFPCPP